MSNEFITLADKTQVDNSYVVKLSDVSIAVYVKGVHTFGEMYEWFGSAGKTRIIKSDQYGDKQTWEGFTEPTAIQINENDACACLKKPQ